MATQLALVDAPGQRFFKQRGRRQRGQQLGVQQALDQIGRRRHEADTPAGRQNFGETADINRALQSVERAQPGRVLGCEVAVGVVFDDMKLMLLRQLQHTMGAAGGDAVARRVVKHADADEQLGAVLLAIPGDDVQIRAGGRARHRQNSHAHRIEPGKFNRPAGFFDHHAVAGAQQGAADDIERVRGADGGDDLIGPGVHVDGIQLLRQRPP